MDILTESEVNRDLQRLDRAWRQRETFVFAPDKSGVSPDWIPRAVAQLPAELQTDHFALLTSGTTGEPKLVVGSRRRAEELAGVLHRLQESEPVAETIVALPLTYCYAFVNQWVWAARHGRRLVTTGGFGQPDVLLSALQKADRAMLCLVGAQVPLLVRYFEGQSFPGVIRVHFAGGRFPQEKIAAVRAIFPEATIFNNYGCTEAMPRLTLRRAEGIDSADDVGRPLPGVELKTGKRGELLFRSPYGAVALVDRDGFSPLTPDVWVPTGDLGERTARGSWRLTGRSGEVFKRHGEKISIATLLSTVTGCWPEQAAFYRQPDPAGEEGHVLVVSPHPSTQQVRTVLRAFRAGHPRAHWPLRIESVDALPLLPNGKVDVRAISRLGDKTVHWYQRI